MAERHEKLKTKPHGDKRWIDLSPGTCFIKKDLPYPDGTRPVNGVNNHPFIVISENPDSVECLMAQTLKCDAEGKDRSYRTGLNGSESAVELRNTHPPLQDPKIRTGWTDVSKIICIPKEELWKDPGLKICCDGGDKMDKDQVDRLRKWAGELMEDYFDPWECGDRDYATDDEYRKKTEIQENLSARLTPGVAPKAARGPRIASSRTVPARYAELAEEYDTRHAQAGHGGLGS